MTGPEHYTYAERLLDMASEAEIGDDSERYLLAKAQVHATLALAAAIADGPAVMRPEDRDEWDRATGRAPDEPEEEPPAEEYDPGPEVDDEGGMSEYRYQMHAELSGAYDEAGDYEPQPRGVDVEPW